MEPNETRLTSKTRTFRSCLTCTRTDVRFFRFPLSIILLEFLTTASKYSSLSVTPSDNEAGLAGTRTNWKLLFVGYFEH